MRSPFPNGLLARVPPLRFFYRLLVGKMFHRYFDIVPADTDRLRDEAFRIRYEVYCEELKFEPKHHYPDKLECDHYDDQSLHCLLRYKPTGEYAGCVRVVFPNPHKPDEPLPFERA